MEHITEINSKAPFGKISFSEGVFYLYRNSVRFYCSRERRDNLEPIRLLVDIDGTLAEFKAVDTLETLYEEGYFRNLKPNENVLDAVKQITYLYPEIEVYVMSAVLTDSKYALKEKNEWLDEYLPQVDKEHRIFPPCGENKLNYVPGGIRETDHLLDDYSKNLTLWEPPAKGIKLLNGINHTHETWQGNMLRYDHTPEELANRIVGIMKGELFVRDEKPQEKSVEDILSQLNEIREEVHEIQKFMNISSKEETYILPDSLEDRYTQAMMLAGWRRVEPPPGSPMTIAFENRYGTEQHSFDGWEMVGQELEKGDITPVFSIDNNHFEELIHPQGRIIYYTRNLGGTGLEADAIPVEYEDFTSALSAYDKAALEIGDKSIGYTINGELVELAAFNSAEMKHNIRQQNWNQLPMLSQNEVSVVRTNLENLRNVLERSNTYHGVMEGVSELIDSTMSEMIWNNNKDIWGSWIGRVANTHRPQDYVEVDISGVRRTGEVTIEVLMVHANEIMDAKMVSFAVDENNFADSLRRGMDLAKNDFAYEYFNHSIELLETDMQYPMQLYAPGMEHTLEEHYRALEDRGYAFESNREAFFHTLQESKEPAAQVEDMGFTHVPKTIKPKL